MNFLKYILFVFVFVPSFAFAEGVVNVDDMGSTTAQALTFDDIVFGIAIIVFILGFVFWSLLFNSFEFKLWK